MANFQKLNQNTIQKIYTYLDHVNLNSGDFQE